MNIGDRVRTTPEWTSQWGTKPLFGHVREMRDRGPINPERTVKVVLSEESRGEIGRGISTLWFAPRDLLVIG
jgi:hypothetical protein